MVLVIGVLAWGSLPPIPALASCAASAATDIGRRHYEAGARVTLDQDGKPVPAC